MSELTRESTDLRQEQAAAPQDGLGGDCVAVMQAAYPRHGDHLTALPKVSALELCLPACPWQVQRVVSFTENRGFPIPSSPATSLQTPPATLSRN